MRLKADPAKVTVKDIVEAVQGPLCFNDCTAPDGFCERMDNCCYHPLWNGLTALVASYLDSVSLEDVVKHRRFPAVESQFADREAFCSYAGCGTAWKLEQ